MYRHVQLLLAETDMHHLRKGRNTLDKGALTRSIYACFATDTKKDD